MTKVLERGSTSIDTFIERLVFILLPTIVEAVLVCGIFLHLGTPSIATVTLSSVAVYFAFTKVRTIEIRR